MRNIFIYVSLLISFIAPSINAADVFVYNFNVTVAGKSGSPETAANEDAIQRLSQIYQKSFASLSSDSIAYKALSGLSSNKISGTIRTITNTVSALAICFFYNVEYLMYGDVLIDNARSQYTTQIKVYSKSHDDVIYELRYAKLVLKDEEGYANELASVVNGQLQEAFHSLPQSDSEKAIERFEGIIEQSETQKEEQVAKENQKQQNDEKILSYMEKLLDTLQKNETQPKNAEKPVNTKKIFGYYLGAGYFLELSGAWKDVTMPLVTIQTGPKWNLLLVDTPSFDLYIRPGFFVDYSVSMNTLDGSYNYYSRINSIGFSVGLELFFEFSNIFGFSIGGGGQYDLDFIAFREGVSNDFYAYQSYGLGAYGNAGLEFMLGKEKNFVLGATNIIHFIFYNSTYIDDRIMLTSMFKI